MPKYQPIDLIGGFYTDDAKPWAAQDTVNWLPLAAEVAGTRTVTKLRSPPGLTLYSTLATGPVRQTHNVEGKLFAVSGSSLYEIAVGGGSTNRGAIPGVGRVSMAHNQISFGNQLTIVNSDSSGYVWNTVTNTLTKITDPGFDGSVMVDFLDGYMIHTDPFGRFWFHSELADALSFNTLDRYSSEASPDKIVAAKAFQSEVVVFNDSTIEFFVNVGGESGSTFENKQIVINRGCASRYSIARINNTLAWLAEDGAVYVLNGYREQKISTVPIEQAIAGLDWSQAFAEVWEDQGHSVYYLTFPDGRTWGFDFTSGLWTRRESYELNRWRMNSLTFWQGKWIVGDFQQGLLYQLEWGVYHENGQFMVSERATGVSHSNQNRVQCPYMELIFDTGQGGPDTNVILSGDLGSANIGEAVVGFSYSASGGVGPYVFTLDSGALPGGLTLNPDGTVTGTRTVGGVFSWVVRVTAQFGATTTLSDSSETYFDPLWLDVLSLLQNPQAIPPTDYKAPLWGYPAGSNRSPILEVGTGPFGENCFGFVNIGGGVNSNLRTSTASGGATTTNLINPLVLRPAYTVEAFFKPLDAVGTEVLWAQGTAGVGDLEVRKVGAQYSVSTTSSGTNFILGGTVTPGVWQHVAMTRSGGNALLFIDGVLVGSVARPEQIGTPFTYGSSANTNNPLDGRMDMLRITGVARYTSSFSVPTRLFPTG